MKKSQLKAIQEAKALQEAVASLDKALAEATSTAQELENAFAQTTTNSTNDEQASYKTLPAETDAELWARYFALRETESEAKAAQEVIKQELFERAVEAGYFEAGTQTANFPNGVGKIRLSFRADLKEPKSLPDDFFLLEENDELVELVPAKKKIIELLKAEEGAYPEVVEYLQGLGFELKYVETRTFLKQ